MNRIEAFGWAVRQRRLESKLTQLGLAEKAGLHINFVSLVERGKTTPALDSIYALADALDVRASQLLQWAEEHAPDSSSK